jgi:aryl-alcohol dehydrogenase-like predicted oxidoreductase
MQYGYLPGIALSPSRIVLGAPLFGSDIPERTAFALLDAFVDAGGNVIDTAHVYAAWLPGGEGASERTIGQWMAARGNRERVVISTKGGHPDLRSGARPRLAAHEIAKDLAESLDRLQTDRADIYWLHRDDPDKPVREILDALQPHLASGQIRAIGCSNWSAARIQEASACAVADGLTGFCANQVGFSLAEYRQENFTEGGMRYMDGEALAFHSGARMPVFAYSSQARGFFSGKYAPETAGSSSVIKDYGTARNFARLRAARALAAKRRVSANRIAVAFLLAQPFPVFAVVGPHSLDQLADSCGAADVFLDPDEIRQLGEGIAG